jgi:hypothetical protein
MILPSEKMAPQPIERIPVAPGNQKYLLLYKPPSESVTGRHLQDFPAHRGPYPAPRELRELLLHLRPDEEGSSSLAARVCRGQHAPDEVGGGRTHSEYAPDEAPQAGRPVCYGPLRSSARTSGRSVMMPSTPWPSRRRMSASESMVHTSTRSPRSWAARMNPGVTTRSPW